MTKTRWIMVALGAIALVAALMFFLGRETAPPPDADQAREDAAPAPAPAAPAPAPEVQPSRPKAPDAAAQVEPPLGDGLPRRVGECALTSVEWVGTRLEANGQPVPDSGSAIRLENGVYGVSYYRVPAVDASTVGDPVRTCLVSIPQGCPAGDERGREYLGTNQRTGLRWTLPDAAHMCGGA